MAQTVNELLPAIGATVMVRFEAVYVPCVVHDAKSSYGRERLKIEPVGGSGTQWVELGRVTRVCGQSDCSQNHAVSIR